MYNVRIFAPGVTSVAKVWNHLLDYNLEGKVQLIYDFKKRIVYKYYKFAAK